MRAKKPRDDDPPGHAPAELPVEPQRGESSLADQQTGEHSQRNDYTERMDGDRPDLHRRLLEVWDHGVILTRMPNHRTAAWRFRLPAEFGHREVTEEVAALVARSGVRDGLVVVSLTGSTGAITTIEYEPGALADLRRALDQIAPANDDYEHNARWGDGNGFSHVRSALLKTSIAIPIVDGKPALGEWQQIVVINLDNRAREREVIAVICG